MLRRHKPLSDVHQTPDLLRSLDLWNVCANTNVRIIRSGYNPTSTLVLNPENVRSVLSEPMCEQKRRYSGEFTGASGRVDDVSNTQREAPPLPKYSGVFQYKCERDPSRHAPEILRLCAICPKGHLRIISEPKAPEILRSVCPKGALVI